LENVQGQQGPALGQRAIGNVFAGDLLHVLSQFAFARRPMEDQSADQVGPADYGRTPAAWAVNSQQSLNAMPGNHLMEKGLKGSGSKRCFVSHPQLNGVLRRKVQV
jgi:hypothetical protein